MRVLFLTDGPQVPSSRFRVQQFIPHLTRRGLDCSIRYAYGASYNSIATRPWAPAYKVACRLRLGLHALASARYDVVFLQRLTIPVTAMPEILAHRFGARFVFDFDDAIYLGPGGAQSVFRANAFRSAIELGEHVIAGNRHLAEVAAVPHKTTIIPTVVDTDFYVPPRSRSATRKVVIGWMGTASNFPLLRSILPEVLAALNADRDIVFRVVSNARLLELEGRANVEQIGWSQGAELELLQSFDIGLMPLKDNALARGKCGFKMLQYMAVGAAAIVSAVGANIDIVGDSGAATLIPPGNDWTKTILALAHDKSRRRHMGTLARQHVVAQYSLGSAVPKLYDILKGVVSRTGQSGAL